MSQTDLAELRRLREAATKGQWVAPDLGDDCLYASEDMMEQRHPLAHFVRLENRKYIAAAHNTLPALLDELEAARAELEALKVPLAIYERHTKLIGAAEELERAAATKWEAASYGGNPILIVGRLQQRAAQLRREAEEK